MPFIDIKVIEGVFTPAEQRELVERVSEAVVSVEGEALRPCTHTVVTETRSFRAIPPRRGYWRGEVAYGPP